MSDKEIKKYQDKSIKQEQSSNDGCTSSDRSYNNTSPSPSCTSKLNKESQQQNLTDLEIAPSPPKFVPIEEILKAANGVTNM